MAGLLVVGGVAAASTVLPAADVSTPTETATVAPVVVPTTQAPAPVVKPTSESVPVRAVASQTVDPTTEAPMPPAETPPVVPTVDPTAEPGPAPTLDTTPNVADVAPVWHQATCAAPDGSVDIPAVEGVSYDVDTIPGPEGNYLLGVGDHTVHADSGSGHWPQWSFTVDAPTGC